LLSSSLLRTMSCMWRGTIRSFLSSHIVLLHCLPLCPVVYHLNCKSKMEVTWCIDNGSNSHKRWRQENLQVKHISRFEHFKSRTFSAATICKLKLRW
jgi:hypothetical protein